MRSRNLFDRTFAVATADLLEIELQPPVRKESFHYVIQSRGIRNVCLQIAVTKRKNLEYNNRSISYY